MALKNRKRASSGTPQATSTSRKRKKTTRRAYSAPRSSSRSASKEFDLKKTGTDLLLPILTMMGGIYVANQIDKKLMKPATETVSGIMGIDGIDSKTVTPLLMVGIGVAVNHFVDNEHIKNVAKGAIMYGGFRAVEAFSGKKLTLNGIEDEVATAPAAIAPTTQVRGLEGKDEDALRQALEIAMAKPVSGAPEAAQEVVKEVSGLADVTTDTIGESITTESISIMGDIITSELLNGTNDEFGDIEGYEDNINGLDGDGEPIQMY